MDTTILIERIQNTLGESLPTLFGALVILLIGYFVAKVLQSLARRLLRKTNLDNRVAAAAGGGISPEETISKIVYYIVMVIVLLMAMETLGVTQILDPLKNMVDSFLGFIPNLVAAGMIGFIGYVIATIVSSLVGMASATIERLGTRLGISSGMDLTGVLKKVVFIVIFVPILITALDALNMNTITDPAKDMLGDFIGAIPRIIAAVIIIGLFYLIGRFVSGLLKSLLVGVNTDQFSEKLGVSRMIGEKNSLSGLIANAVFFFIVFAGIITGMEQLEFEQLNNILSTVFEMTGRIAFGLILLLLGNFLAGMAYRVMSGSSENTFLASLARVVILGLFLAIALRAMGIADDIVNLAFGLTLGAVAVAVALSFGLGGREAAGEQMRRILNKFNGSDLPAPKEPTK